MVEIELLDGSTTEADRKTIELLRRTNKVSLTEAAAGLTTLLGLHPSNAHRVRSYLEKL